MTRNSINNNSYKCKELFKITVINESIHCRLAITVLQVPIFRVCEPKKIGT
jgi:hypothetical protein